MADTGIPFITAIANDIYARVNSVMESLEKVGGILSQIMQDMHTTITDLSVNIKGMLDETNQNKAMMEDMFSNLSQNFITQLREIQDQKIEELKSEEMKKTVAILQKVSTNLNRKMYDLQFSLITAGIHTVLDALKSYAMAGPVAGAQPMVFSDKAPIPVGEPPAESAEPKRPKVVTHGQKTVTSHEAELEKMRRKQRLFGRY